MPIRLPGRAEVDLAETVLIEAQNSYVGDSTPADSMPWSRERGLPRNRWAKTHIHKDGALPSDWAHDN